VAFADSELQTASVTQALVQAPQMHSNPLAHPGGHVARKCDSLSPSAAVVLQAPIHPNALEIAIDRLKALTVFMIALL
jgi:hypothetical protein